MGGTTLFTIENFYGRGVLPYSTIVKILWGGGTTLFHYSKNFMGGTTLFHYSKNFMGGTTLFTIVKIFMGGTTLFHYSKNFMRGVLPFHYRKIFIGGYYTIPVEHRRSHSTLLSFIAYVVNRGVPRILITGRTFRKIDSTKPLKNLPKMF